MSKVESNGNPGGPVPDRDVDAREYAISVVSVHLRRWQQHERGARVGDDAKALHGMRVAAQRMRAALRFYKRQLAGDSARLRRELGWARRQLGAARDLDVQLEQFAEWRDDLAGDGASLASIEMRMRGQRREERLAMSSALDSARGRETFAAIERLLAAPLRDGLAGPGEPIGRVAPLLIARAHRRARRAAELVVPSAADSRFHELRRRLRDLRYVVEFHEPLYQEDAKPLVGRLVALQDALGVLQDSAVARENLRRLAEDETLRTSAGSSAAIDRLRERYERRSRSIRDRLTNVEGVLAGPAWSTLQRTLRGVSTDHGPDCA